MIRDRRSFYSVPLPNDNLRPVDSSTSFFFNPVNGLLKYLSL
jgi:hypothetical protein